MPAKSTTNVSMVLAQILAALVAMPAPAQDDDAPQKVAAVPKEKGLPRYSETELLQQLQHAKKLPDVTGKHAVSILRAYRAAFELNQESYTDPGILLREFPFLAGMPIRTGAASRLDAQSAFTLGRLAPKLHAYLDLLTIQKLLLGQTPDFVKLQEALRQEMRGKQPEWLRPAAVPALVQILMEGDVPMRLLLVAMLGEIQGPAATIALAQRAVFDVSPEVRTGAVRALGGRPPEAPRNVFLRALRYPWAPVADHAAEALVTLKDGAAIPHLIALLKLPDPTAPYPVGDNRYRVAEVVRLNHVTNCLYCHPPGSASDAVARFDPNVTRMVAERSAGGGGHYQGRGSAGGSAGNGGRGRITQVTPVFMRADVTFMRQDFSQKLPVNPRLPESPTVRYDFLLRVRSASASEIRYLRTRDDETPSYPQRDSVLFALRELSGQDAGLTAEAWLELFPRAEHELTVARLSANLLMAPADRKGQRLHELREGKGAACTEALAVAVPQLSGALQRQARAALAERLARMTVETLRDKLQEDNVEVRRAAATAAATKAARELIPDLIKLLHDAESEVASAAHAALKELTGKDFGPSPRAALEARIVAAADWKNWWATQQDAGK